MAEGNIISYSDSFPCLQELIKPILADGPRNVGCRYSVSTTAKPLNSHIQSVLQIVGKPITGYFTNLINSSISRKIRESLLLVIVQVGT